MYTLRRNGRAVPDDVAVVGWGGTTEGGFAIPSLTTVVPDVARMAGEAVNLIIRGIEEPNAQPREVVVGHSLLAGESTTGTSP